MLLPSDENYLHINTLTKTRRKSFQSLTPIRKLSLPLLPTQQQLLLATTTLSYNYKWQQAQRRKSFYTPLNSKSFKSFKSFANNNNNNNTTLKSNKFCEENGNSNSNNNNSNKQIAATCKSCSQQLLEQSAESATNFLNKHKSFKACCASLKSSSHSSNNNSDTEVLTVAVAYNSSSSSSCCYTHGNYLQPHHTEERLCELKRRRPRRRRRKRKFYPTATATAAKHLQATTTTATTFRHKQNYHVQQQQQQQKAQLSCTNNKINFNHFYQHKIDISNNSSNQLSAIATTATTTSATTTTTIAATKIANKLSSKQKSSPARISHSAYYLATTLRFLLTTLTTLGATTTTSATTLATAIVAAILVAIAKTTRNALPAAYRQLQQLNSGGFKVILLLLFLNLSAKFCLAGYHEKRLLHDLLDPYNTLERPVLNESDPLQLSFGLTLMQIIDVDEKNQLLVTNVWLKLEWNDMNLRWNISDYGGVKDLRIPPHRIWKPDVLMYNSADEGFDGTYQTNVVVRNNGSCLYVPPGIFKSTCKIDITWFPFDDQRCEMKFGSWTYDGFQLDLQLQDEAGGDISSYVLNGEWELLGVPGKRNEIYYNCCPEPYIDITFAIIIRRRTLYYFFNLIIPCVLIASMALLGFTLPPDSGEKLSLGVTILLSLTVFLNMVAETMPATSDAVPLLGTYFNCIMFMVASSVVSTILILNYHHRNADTHEMSEWIRIIFLCWLPWILRMSRPGRPLILEFPTTPCSDTSSERKHQILSDVELKERSSKSLLANVLDIDDDFRHNCRPMTPGGTLPHNPAFYRTVYGQGDDGSIGPIGSTRMPDAVSHHTCIKSSTEYELGLILKEIRFITDQLRKEDEDNDIANDWKFAAMVVDRLCLIIFTMFTILATIAVLLSAPHIIVS